MKVDFHFFYDLAPVTLSYDIFIIISFKSFPFSPNENKIQIICEYIIHPGLHMKAEKKLLIGYLKGIRNTHTHSHNFLFFLT